jgi:hypothetical protein
MTPDELRAIMNWLRDRVYLKDPGPDGEVRIGFDTPTDDTLDKTELNRQGCRQVLDAPWWDEMVADVVETPEMCDPGDPPEQVLRYARDVVSEFIRKRATL